MRVLIAEDELLTRMDLKYLLSDAGIEVVAEAKDGLDAVQLAKELRPDLVLIDVKMPHLDGFAAAKMIINNGYASCIVMLTAYSDPEYIQNAMKVGVYGYLVKPINPKNLLPTLKLAYQKAQDHQKLNQELEKSKQKLVDRVAIERAKGYLMQQNNIEEEQAYRMLRELSQQKRCSMRFVSDAIIMQHETDT